MVTPAYFTLVTISVVLLVKNPTKRTKLLPVQVWEKVKDVVLPLCAPLVASNAIAKVKLLILLLVPEIQGPTVSLPLSSSGDERGIG